MLGSAATVADAGAGTRTSLMAGLVTAATLPARPPRPPKPPRPPRWACAPCDAATTSGTRGSATAQPLSLGSHDRARPRTGHAWRTTTARESTPPQREVQTPRPSFFFFPLNARITDYRKIDNRSSGSPPSEGYHRALSKSFSCPTMQPRTRLRSLRRRPTKHKLLQACEQARV